MRDHAELINLLQQGDGASGILQRAIFERYHFPTMFFGSEVESWSYGDGSYTINTKDGLRHLFACRAPHYTTSFDAALTLVPQGYYWHAGEGKTRDEEPLGAASIIAPGTLRTISEAEHPSVIVALCIAALKARAVLEAAGHPHQVNESGADQTKVPS